MFVMKNIPIRALAPALLMLILWSACGNKTADTSRYVVEGLKIRSVNNEQLYVNYNINNNRIDAIVENDGVPGNNFLIEFLYPEGVQPLSVAPNLPGPIDCAEPVQFDLLFPGDFRQTYTLNLKENAPAPEFLVLDSIRVLTTLGASTDVQLSNSGTDYIGLTQGGGTNFKLQLFFPNRVTPESITPDPNVARDYSTEQTFTVKYTQDVTKQYTIKIGRHNPAALTRSVIKGGMAHQCGQQCPVEQCRNCRMCQFV
jgi:hypothetical protein